MILDLGGQITCLAVTEDPDGGCIRVRLPENLCQILSGNDAEDDETATITATSSQTIEEN